MKSKYHIIMITVLFFVTLSLLGVIYVRYYEGNPGILTAFRNEESQILEPQDSETEDAQTEVTEREEETEKVVFTASDPSYFDDALFIGDSRVYGIYCYGTLDNADFFAIEGMTIYELWEETTEVKGVGKTDLQNLLSTQSYKKIYLMMGVNEMGEDLDKNAAAYEKALARLHELVPDAVIYICSNLHVSEKLSNEDELFNNDKIDYFNEKIHAFEDGETFFYLEVNQMFNDENGNLAAEYTWDNVHVYGRYYAQWCDWFCQNTIQK